ncbi:MAG: D-aminoacyl-tRNA deacylase [Nitrososphaeria archaeon]
MKIEFIASSLDPAGKNIALKVIEKFGLEEKNYAFNNPVYEKNDLRLLFINVESIMLDQIDLPFDSELIIVLSKHKSVRSINSLTTHPTGNLINESKQGGRPKHVSYTNPWYMSEYYRTLTESYQSTLKNQVILSMEVTHHGPTEKTTPIFFVEIGSDERQWKNPFYADEIADALYKTIMNKPRRVDAFVGFGGGHYAPAFSHYVVKEGVAVGHMVPKYALIEGVDEEVLLSLFSKSLLDKPRALVDKKGVASKEYKELLSLFDRNSIEVVKI